ncbi:MAG: lysylphosphatidylglycerol synthase transmembrane domain-containing protein [Solirubrobacteraceae bacterium]|jgi:uncharacterized protein (TIRG00374 family)
MSRRIRQIALRLVLSGAFIVLALRGISASRVFDDIGNVSAGWFVLALGLLSVSYALGAVRWRTLALGQQIDLGLAGAARYTWIGLFFTNVLPTGFGGDAVRAWLVGRRTDRLPAVTASVLADRLSALWALVTVGALGVILDGAALPGLVVVAALLSCAAVALGSVLLLAPAPARVLIRLSARWSRGSSAIERVSAGLATYNGRRDLLAKAVALSLAAQGCVILAAFMLARSLGLHIGVGLLATTIPVALLATATPTNINGLGVRETVFRALLVPAGVAPALAVAFSLTTVAAGAIVSLPGALAWITLHHRPAAREITLDGPEPRATAAPVLSTR